MAITEKQLNDIGETIRKLQNVIFELAYTGQVELPNGHVYLIDEDTRSFHPFRSIKRVNPNILRERSAAVEDARLYICKGSPAEVLLDFIADFDNLFVAVQKEKIKKYLLNEILEEERGERLYNSILVKAENLLDRYSDSDFVKHVIMDVSQKEGFIPEVDVMEDDENRGNKKKVESKAKAKKPVKVAAKKPKVVAKKPKAVAKKKASPKKKKAS